MIEKDQGIGVRSMGIDWWTVLIYLLLVFFGWISIYAAVYTDDNAALFDISKRYGMQLIWIGVSLAMGIVLLLIESRVYHMFAYIFYIGMLLLMLYVSLFGDETNAARSWLTLGGGIKVQPVEFMKVATALALARYVSSNSFDIRDYKNIFYIGIIIFLPVMIILLQNDTGSALVFFGFFIMLYREGFGRQLYILVGLVIILALLSFLLEPFAMVLLIMGGCTVSYAVLSRKWKSVLRYLSVVGVLFFGLIWFLSPFWSLLIAIAITIPILLGYAQKNRLKRLTMVTLAFIGFVVLSLSVDFVFDNVLQVHQQKRILDLLGIEKDPQGWSYNVIQSKIAIGSGGVTGKGFLKGTQTKFSFVPEQSTDFIFCTVGEEWGFIGSIAVVLLFGALIIRLILMGERQKEPFARVYCYSVASIILTHFVINIGMTIGIFPVVGIPLPFFSYGGSSLLAFTILLFIAIRLDSKQVAL